MKRSFSVRQVVFHPSTLAVLSGLGGAFIGFLINLVSGGDATQIIWIALVFAMLFSFGITAWQVYTQEKAGEQWMTMLQELVFQTYFLAILADKPQVSQMAQQRLGQVLKPLSAAQQVSMLQFFSQNGFPAAFIGDALQGSGALAGADLRRIALPQINLSGSDLSRVNLSEANLSEANLYEAVLIGAGLSGANLQGARLSKAVLVGANLTGANLSGADLREAVLSLAQYANASSGPGRNLGQRSASPALLSNVLLSHANLQGAILMGVDLKGANLQGADLSGAILSQVNLQGADLTGANLSEAFLDLADLRDAKVTQEQLDTARSSNDIKRDTELSLTQDLF